MKVCYADLNATDISKMVSGVGMWAKCLNVPMFKYDGQEIIDYAPDVILCCLYGGTFQIPKHLKQTFPNAKIICVFDYNSLEIHNVVGLCKLEDCFPFVDIWLAPKYTASWIRAVTEKPVVEVYRPYEVDEFEYVPRVDRDKVIIVSEHTKSRQCFEARIVARRIMEKLGEEYEVYIKTACIKALTGPCLENSEKDSTCDYYKLNPIIKVWDIMPKLEKKPMLAIDHFPTTLLGGWHIVNAFYGTPSIGIKTSQACKEAFPYVCVRPYDLETMVECGVRVLKDVRLWALISENARKYAEEHWSFEACLKIWNMEVLPLCQR